MKTKNGYITKSGRVFVPSVLQVKNLPLRRVLKTAVELAQNDNFLGKVLEEAKGKEVHGRYRYATHPSMFQLARELRSIWQEKFRAYDYDFFTYAIFNYIVENGLIDIPKDIFVRVYLHPNLPNGIRYDVLVDWLVEFSKLPREDKIQYISKYLNTDVELELGKMVSREDLVQAFLDIKESLPFYLSKTKIIWGGVYEFAFNKNLIKEVVP
jgi:hypothetical protein